jgi:hypothetical protein
MDDVTMSEYILGFAKVHDIFILQTYVNILNQTQNHPQPHKFEDI